MLPGGITDKLGNRYETWWTVQQLLRLITGSAISIRLEPPGIDKAEFVLTAPDGSQEYHQAKRSLTDGTWTLAKLASSEYKVLQSIYPLLAGNTHQFHFISGCAAQELKELAERARLLESWEEFSNFGLEAKVHRENFDRLLREWGSPAGPEAWQALRRVFVHVADEDQFKQSVTSELKSLYLDGISDIRERLRGLVLDAAGSSLTRDELLAILQERGHFLRRITSADSALPAIESVTSCYLDGIRFRLIGRTLIPRTAANEVVAGITSGNGSITALTGKAGGGKSGCALQIVETLKAAGYPVLALRLDRIPPVNTTAELGVKLQLEESPVLMLAAAAQGRPAVLVIDQLDAVSTISGRHAGFLGTVQALLEEARGVSVRARIHVILVCRKFDWENDHRLRRMTGKEDKVIELADFTPQEVTAALQTAGMDSAALPPSQMTLLQVPQNLALFLESPTARAEAAVCHSRTHLYHAYWKDKREAVNRRAHPEPEIWAAVLERLTSAMTESQQLSVPRECLDAFSTAYLDQMISEGVLSTDGHRFGFGHESFFDYCYARWFVGSGHQLLSLLLSGEQHVFRRAQMRQVLEYLRDAEIRRYCREVQSLLTSTDVRTHIKDLTLSLLASVPEVKDEEWALLFPRIEAYIAVIAAHGEHTDKAEVHIWRHFFGSDCWFRAANERGVIARWLASEGDYVANLMTHYVRFHQRKNGDAVAALLEPYADDGGQWPLRLRFCMEMAQHENSRRFFDLMLRLIDNGVLDEARCRFAQNGTFWSMLYGLTQAKPEWVPVVFAHWLRRRFVMVTAEVDEAGQVNWSKLWGDDESESVALGEAARTYPGIFVENTFALFLEISDAAAPAGDELPRRDAVWHNLYPDEYVPLYLACQMALRAALEHLARDNADQLPDLIASLRQRDTYFSNALLFAIYTAGAVHCADEAVELICAEQWRLECGYCGGEFWLTRELITATAPVCSPEKLTALESVLLNYKAEWELSAKGRDYRGRPSLDLLSAIPEHLRSEPAKARFRELQRKHGSPSGKPDGGRSGFVGPPIEKEKAAHMTDEQWLRAIAKYASEERSHRFEDYLKGGALELARLLEEFTKGEPERFGSLALQFPPGTNATYIDHVIRGLGGASVQLSLKLDVCRKAYSESPAACAKTIARFLGGVEEQLPVDCLAMIQWIATEHPDPDEEFWLVTEKRKTASFGGDIYNCGINSARGCAAEAVASLIGHDAAYIARLMPALQNLVQDKSTAVRACAARALLTLAVQNAPQAIALFTVLAEHGPMLLATPFGERFIFHGLRDHFCAMRPFIEILLRSGLEAPAQSGAQLACLAVLYGHDAQDLVEEALSGPPHQRQGVAKIAASNIAQADCRAWCEPLLLRFFADTAPEVRREAGHCFSRLEDAPLAEYEGLIAAYCDSPAYEEDSFWILQFLEKTRYRLPNIVWTVCHRFLARFSREGADISTGRAGDARTVATLVYRTYQQHLDDEWAPRCLDLIDTMLMEGIYDAGSGLAAFER